MEHAAKTAAAEVAANTDLFVATSQLVNGNAKFVLFKGICQDPLVPPTPTDGRASVGKDTDVHEYGQAVIGQLLNTKIANFPWQELYGDPFFHPGFPTPPAARSSGVVAAITSGKTLPYHLDLEGLRNEDHVPEYLFLGCVRGGNDAHLVTKLVDNVDILKFVPAHLQQVMREARFILPNKTRAFVWDDIPQPILTGTDEDPTIIKMVDGPLAIKPAYRNDAAAWRALYYLDAAVDKADRLGLAQRIHFEAGDLLVFKNKLVLHSRENALAPLYDGTDRILYRSYWMSLNVPGNIIDGNEVRWTSTVRKVESFSG